MLEIWKAIVVERAPLGRGGGSKVSVTQRLRSALHTEAPRAPVGERLMPYPIPLILVIFTSLCIAGLCFWGAKMILKQAEKHSQFTKIDQNLPLHGRWLRYAIASILTVIGLFSSLVAFLCTLAPIMGDRF